MSQVFISYSRRDIDFVNHLVQTLEAVRIDNWLDQDDIEPAADWRERIQAGIESADNFIFVISPASVQSNECGQELELGIQNGKRLIPIVYQEVDPQLAHPTLASINWIFFRKGVDDFQTAFTKLVTAIKTDLAWAHFHSRLQTRALEWKRKNRDPSFLLRGQYLQDAEKQLASAGPDKNPQPIDLQRQYVLASRQDATHRQRRNFMMVSIALVLVVGLAIAAFIQWGVAETQRGLAEEAKSTAVSAEATAVAERETAIAAQMHAETQQAIAVAAQKDAETQRRLAEEAESTAVSAEATAVAAQKDAETQRDIAISRQLAAQALVSSDERYDLALLLAVEASKGSADGKLSLSSLLLAEPYLIRIISNSDEYFGQGPGGFITDLALSPNGDQLVAKSLRGARLWEIDTKHTEELDLEGYKQDKDDWIWASDQDPKPNPEKLIQTLDIETLSDQPSSAGANRTVFAACRASPSAGGAPGCSSLIYIFDKEFERLITSPKNRSPKENDPNFQIELEGGLFKIWWEHQKTADQPPDFKLYSVALANKATDQGSTLVGWLYNDSNTKYLATATAYGRHGSKLALILWDLSDKKPVLEIFSPLWGTEEAKFNFSNEGAAMDVYGLDKDIQIDIDPESWQKQACEIAGRNLTETEWNQFLYWKGPYDPKYKTCPQWPDGE